MSEHSFFAQGCTGTRIVKALGSIEEENRALWSNDLRQDHRSQIKIAMSDWHRVML